MCTKTHYQRGRSWSGEVTDREEEMEQSKWLYKINGLSLSQEELLIHESLFHNANGYIGIRANFEEGYTDEYTSIRGSYINGFYDIVDMKQAEKLFGLVEEKQVMTNIADTQGIKLKLDDEEFSMFEGTVLESSRWLDMLEGYTARRVIWESPNGKKIEIRIKRMTSFVKLSMFTIEYSVKALNFDGELTFTSTHIGEVNNYCNVDDPRVASESHQGLLPTERVIKDGVSCIVSETSRSGLRVCTAVKNVLSNTSRFTLAFYEGIGVHEMITDIHAGEVVTLTKYTIFVDSIRNQNLLESALTELKEAITVPLVYWYEAQRNYLNNYWDNGNLEIEGDDSLNQAVHYNLYQLLQSVGKDEFCNIAAKGLSGEGYEGHYFWDTEMYIQPYFTLTNPEITKNLIGYRYNILKYAKLNAQMLGHKKGALYPWRTIMGLECSGYFPAGTAQYHISGDVAYAVVAYYLATKDIDFMSEKGAEILIETARLWMDVGNYYDGKFRICGVTGPDEYTCLVNNNYYTNLSAQYNLRWASKIYCILRDNGGTERIDERLNVSEEEIREFDWAAECMYLPFDDRLNINPQDDAFLSRPIWEIDQTPQEKFPLLLHYHPLHLYRFQVCKQADTVMAHFLFEDAQSIDVIRDSFAYYEKITTHDSSLSSSIFSIVASKLGFLNKAYDYFGDSAKLDLFNTHNNTKDGIHTANMGGTYMAIIYGFAGLRLKEEGLFFAPILPEAWDSYHFEIIYEGCKISVKVDKELCRFKQKSQGSKEIYVYGQKYHLDNELIISRYS